MHSIYPTYQVQRCINRSVLSRYPHNGCCSWGHLHPTTLNSTPLHNPTMSSTKRTVGEAKATCKLLLPGVVWHGAVTHTDSPHKMLCQPKFVCFRSRASHDRTWSVVPDRHHLAPASRKQVQRVHHLQLGQLGPCGFARLEFGIVPLCPHHPATVTQFLWPNRSQIQRSSEVHKLCLQ